MSRATLVSLVNVSLALGLALAVRDVVAQSGKKSETRTLVTTACGYGQVTVCGQEHVEQKCVYVFGFDASRTGAFGFNFGGMQCSSGGMQYRYKDFYREVAGGSCVVTRPVQPDATRSRDDEEIASPNSGENESC